MHCQEVAAVHESLFKKSHISAPTNEAKYINEKNYTENKKSIDLKYNRYLLYLK